MTFTVNRKALERELSLLATVAEKKGTMPVLSTTKFDLHDNILTLTATDMDTSLITSLPASGNEWAGCVPSKQLYELVRLFNGEEIQFIPEEGRVVIKWGKSKHKLPTYEADKFPVIEHPTVETVAIDGPTLSKALERALRCITTDATEFWMQGVSLRSIDGMLYVVASNSRQTAISAIESALQADVLIPSRAVAALVKLLSDGTVSVGISDNQVTFQQEYRVFTTRLLDTKFPDWRPLVPASFAHTVTLDPEPSRQAFKLAAVTAYETALIAIPLRLTLTSNEMTIETNESDRGHSSESVAIDCATLNGHELTRGVNGGHFISFLDEDTKTLMAFNDDMRLIQLSYEGEPNYRYITMALKV